MAKIHDTVKKKHGVVIDLDKLQKRYTNRIRTGSLALDIALGGGVPRGSLIEYCGPDRSGKTTMALKLIAEAQKLGEVVMVSNEQEPETSWMEWLGVDTKKLYVARFSCAEDEFDAVYEMVRENKYALIVIDSVVGLPTKNTISTSMSKGVPVGDLVRELSRFINKTVYGLLGYTGEGENLTTLLVTNQIRVRMKEGFYDRGPDYNLPGGYPLRHAKLGSVLFNSGPFIYNEDKSKTIGKTVVFEIIKGKAGIHEGYKGSFDLYFHQVPRVEKGGIDRVMELRVYGVVLGIIRRAGAYFHVLGKKFHGEAELLDGLFHDDKLRNAVEEAIYKKIGEIGNGRPGTTDTDSVGDS